jgi:hypothetical protein
LHQNPNLLSQKERKQLDVGEDHQLYDFGFAQIPIHIMSRVSMWDSLLTTEQKRKKAQLSTELLPQLVLVECLVSSIFGSMLLPHPLHLIPKKIIIVLLGVTNNFE